MKPLQLIASLVLVAVMFSSCKKRHVDPIIGQPICASELFTYTEDFAVNGSTTPADVNFTADPYNVSLTAEFNENVSWTITITGQTSGAVKTFTGRSNEVDVLWWGNADGDVYFEAGEFCQIALTPSCKSSQVVTIKIAQKAIFDHFGLLLFDLDHYFGGAIPSTSPENTDITPSDPSPQGGKCHMMNWPAGNTGWYKGGYIKSDIGIPMGSFAAGLNSDEVYINFYLKGDPSTIVNVAAIESVGGVNYTFKKNYYINWTGWKMVSIKTSDLNIGNPAMIKEIDLTPAPSAYNGKMECYVDFLIITKGKPFSGAN